MPCHDAGAASKARKKYSDVQQQLKDKQARLKQTERVENATLQDLDDINRRINELTSALRASREKLAIITTQLEKLTSQVQALEERLARHKKWIEQKVRAMARTNPQRDMAVAIARAKDLGELMRRWKHLQRLASYEASIIERNKQDLKALSTMRAALDQTRAEHDREKRNLEAAKAEVDKKADQKQRILATVRDERRTQQQMVEELKRAADALLKAIEQEESKDTTYEGGGAFRSLKGKLPWPVQGRVLVPFGTSADPTYKTPVFRNGIYIQATEGSTAKSVNEGKVVFADWFKGYGKLVVINHGEGYHSLYANLSEIFLRNGDIIKGGQAVGSVGNSGMLDKPSLYFEVRFKGKPLNPSQWLRDN